MPHDSCSKELQAIGGDVAWFDKTEIRPGDDWAGHTRAAIERCKLFLPLISVNTERRDEGWFRREWHQAGERAKGIARKFTVPVVIDDDYAGDALRYRQVPEWFPVLHYGHAPSGRITDQLKEEIQEQLRALRRPRI